MHGAELEHWRLAAGDRLILRVDGATLMTWREQRRFDLGIGSGEPGEGDMVVETMVASNHPSIGQRLIDIPFLQKIFHTQALSLQELLFCFSASSLVFFAMEIGKLFGKKNKI